jgi:glycosyltransferase involved in cell wall biosynthesis
MNILVLERELSSIGGQELSLIDVCRGLAERGHGIDLLYNRDGSLYSEYNQFSSSMTKVPNYEINFRSPVKSIPGWLHSIVRASRLHIDVVYINQYPDSMFAGVIAYLKRVPLVCHLRISPARRFCRQWRAGLSFVTRFIANSEDTRLAYINAGFEPGAIAVVYNGINLRVFQPTADATLHRQRLGVPHDAFVVLYAGRFVRSKNIEMIIRAFAQLGTRAGPRRLLLAGGPAADPIHRADSLAYVRQLHDLCEELHISDDVIWIEWCADMASIYQVADVTVLSSVSNRETFGRTLIESMACGTPAVATAVGGMPEILSGEFDRFLVRDGDTDGLTDVLISLIHWRKNDPSLANRCRSQIEPRFSSQAMIAGVERELMQALLAGALRQGPSFNSPAHKAKRA